jgi:hypothetical protein
MLVELFRHGARSPAFNTFNQPYVVTEGPGNLLGNGMRMHYELGQSIRLKYNGTKLFNYTDFRYNYVEMTTSQYQRTILSAYSHLTGLFPLGTGQKITGLGSGEKDYFRIPPYTPLAPNISSKFAMDQGPTAIPLNVIPVPTDDFFVKGMKYTCPGANGRSGSFFRQQVQNNTVLDKFGAKIKAAGYVCDDYFHQGKDWDLNTTGIFADVSKCYYAYYGKAMNRTEDIYNKMKWVFAAYYMDMRYPDDEMAKFYTTKMTQYILDKMDMKIAGTAPQLYVGLSGHEANLFPYMILYRLLNETCVENNIYAEKEDPNCQPGPSFAANIIWELSQDQSNNKWYVRANYNGDKIQLKTCANPDQDGYCLYSDFKAFMTENFILADADYNRVCGKPNNGGGDENKNWMWVALILLFLFLVQLIMFVLCMNKAKKTRTRLNKELTGEVDVEIDPINERAK